MTQYDKIARVYSETQDRRPLRWGITDPSFYERVGNVKGLDVLDLACGDGRLTRQLKLMGAKKVVGIDLEPKMIEIARESERTSPLGIEYHVFDASKLGGFHSFDLVTAGFLLHYAKDKYDLFGMASGVYRNLKTGGRFVTINQNPDCPRNPFKKYGSTVTPSRDPPKEGDKIKIELWDEQGNQIGEPFFNYHWEKPTYEFILKHAGFKDIKWIPMHASQDAIAKRGKEFWDDWLGQPSITLLEARK